MPNHQSHEPFKSFFQRHVDPEKDEELKRTKADIEGKVQKVLKVLKEEDNDGKEELQNLIEVFHEHYQSLYARYDHLTEALRKEAHGKQRKDSSSSSSDSPSKTGTKDGKVESNCEIDTAGIKQDPENALSEVADFRRQLTDGMNEKESLDPEYQSALSKLQEAKKVISELNAEAEVWNVEKSKLLTENADLTAELESLCNVQAELNQKLEDVNTERESLSIAKEVAEFKIEEEKRNSEELRTINGQLQHQKDTMQVELEEVKGELSTLREKLDLAENELNQIQKVAEEEKTSLSLKISHLEDDIKHAENKIQDLAVESSQLIEKLAKTETELLSQQESYEAEKDAAKEKLESAEQELEKLRQMRMAAEKENSSLRLKIFHLEDEIKQANNKMQDLKAQIDNIRALAESLQIHKRQLEEQIRLIVNEGNEASAQVRDLRNQVNAKHMEPGSLLSQKMESGVKLDQTKEDKDYLRKRVRDLIVQVCMSNNKVRELEKMIKDKEDGITVIQKEKREAIRQLCVSIDYYRSQLDFYNKFCPGGVQGGGRLHDNFPLNKLKKIRAILCS